MFSKLFLSIFGVQINVASLFGGVPFTWNRKQKQLVISKQSLKRFHRLGLRLILCIVFWGGRSVHLRAIGDTTDFYLTYCLFCCAIYVFLAYLMIYKDPHYWTQVCNGFIRFSLNFDAKWAKNKGKGRGTRILLKYVLIGIAGPILFLLHYSIYPRGAMYPTSLVPEKWFNFGFYLLGAASVIFHVNALSCTVVHLQFFLIAYMLTVFPLVETEFRPNQRKYQTQDALRVPKNFIPVYRSLDLLHKHVTFMLGPGILPGKYISMKIILFCVYTVLKQWTDMHKWTRHIFMITASGMASHWILWLYWGGWLFKRSKETLTLWKFFHSEDVKDLKILSKVRKSCMPMTVQAENYFKIKRLTVLKYAKRLTRSVLKALLTFN